MTETDVSNLALMRMGVSQSLTNMRTDTTREALSLQLIFDAERDYVLRDFAWGFAKKYVAPTLVGAAPNSDWAYAHRTPADSLFVRRIVPATGQIDPDPPPFSIGQDVTGGLIYSNVAAPTIEYTYKVTDTTQWDPEFISMFAWRLAGVLALSLARMVDLAKQCLELYAAERSAAISRAAQSAEYSVPTGDSTDRARQIVDLALTRIGVSRNAIAARPELQFQVLWPRLRFSDERDYVLRSVPWPWATKYAALSGQVAAPNPDWAYSYTFPADALFIRRITTANGRLEPNPPAFRVGRNGANARVIFTDVTTGSVEYTMQVTDPAEFDAVFASMLAWRIAIHLAPTFADEDKKGEVLKAAQEAYAAKKQEAETRAVLEGQKDTGVDSADPVVQELVNLALLRLGISKDTEPKAGRDVMAEAHLVNIAFGRERDVVLRDFPWSWAKAYDTPGVALGPSPPANAAWAYAYSAPVDLLFVRRIVKPGGGCGWGSGWQQDAHPIPFEVGTDGVQKLIFTNQPNATVEYTRKMTTPAEFDQWDPMFSSMFAWRLAGVLAPLRINDKKAAAAAQLQALRMYQMELAQAQHASVTEGQFHEPPDAEWIAEGYSVGHRHHRL